MDVGVTLNHFFIFPAIFAWLRNLGPYLHFETARVKGDIKRVYVRYRLGLGNYGFDLLPQA